MFSGLLFFHIRIMDNEQLKKEQVELNKLVNEGVTFFVYDYEKVPMKWYERIFGRRKEVVVKRTFTINELTLSTQDRISLESSKIDFDVNEISGMDDKDGLSIARELMENHGKRCAKIVAIAVVNSSNLIESSNGMRVPDPNVIDDYTELFYREIKPSQLLDLFRIIEIMRNNGDFTRSIRLMRNKRTTMPVLIEGEN